MGFVGLFMCGYSIVVKDNRGAIYFLVFFIVCGVMYSVRRRQRKRFNEQLQQQQAKKDKTLN